MMAERSQSGFKASLMILTFLKASVSSENQLKPLDHFLRKMHSLEDLFQVFVMSEKPVFYAGHPSWYH